MITYWQIGYHTQIHFSVSSSASHSSNVGFDGLQVLETTAKCYQEPSSINDLDGFNELSNQHFIILAHLVWLVFQRLSDCLQVVLNWRFVKD